MRRVCFAFALLLASACRSQPSPPAPEPSAAASVAGAPSAAPSASSEDDLADDAPAGSDEVASAAPSASGSAGRSKRRGRGGVKKTLANRPDVKLLGAGSEPRSVLRYKFEKGRSETIRLVNQTQARMKLENGEAPAPVTPEIELLTTLRIDDLLPGPSARRSLSVDQVRVLPTKGVKKALIDQLQGLLSGVAELKGGDVIDDHGVLHEVSLDTSGVSKPELRAMMDALQQSFGQMGAPMPDEAVGVGAKWEVTTRLGTQGLALKQVSAYELTSREGDKGHLKISIRQSAPPGKFNPPGLPEGASAELVAMSSSGTGELDFDLSRCTPAGQVESTTHLEMKANLDGEAQSLTVDTTVTVKFSVVK